MEALSRRGFEIILVTSGSVGIGRQRLRYQQILNTSFNQMQAFNSRTIPPQAAAAIGQGGLMVSCS